MSATMETPVKTDLIALLRTATLPAHEQLDKIIMSSDPFGSRESYARFLMMQFHLQRDLDVLYSDSDLLAVVPDLASRSRFALVQQDAHDLSLTVPEAKENIAFESKSLAEKLGWLFVLEGSRLGAASLFRRAEVLQLNESFGARHLAGPADGPAGAWRAFVQILSGLSFNDQEREEAVAGAISAFEHAAMLSRRYVAEQTES